MITRTLDEIFDEISSQMCESIELSTYEDDSLFSFYYEDHGYIIEGSGIVGGNWYDAGDGYWTPRECYLTNGWGKVNVLTITHFDEETEEESEFSEEVIQNISERLENQLSRYMNKY